MLLAGAGVLAVWFLGSILVGAAVENRPPAAAAGGDPISAMMASGKEGEGGGGGGGMLGMALGAVKVMFPSLAGYLTFAWETSQDYCLMLLTTGLTVAIGTRGRAGMC